MGGPSPPLPPLASPALADEDSDEPQSPELRNDNGSISGSSGIGSGSSSGSGYEGTPSPEFVPRRRRRSLQAQKRLRALSDDDDDDYQVHSDDDNDSDGYERGTMRHEEAYHAAPDESDELFLTPRRPGRTSLTLTGGGGPGEHEQATPSDRAGEYATFDPILALLDEHWTLLRLSAEDEEPPSESTPIPEYLAPLDEVIPGLVSDAEHLCKLERDRHVMSAVRDADILDASCAAYQQECETLRIAADTARRKAARLVRENALAAREIGALHEAMATLQAARDVDARVNSILASDQAAEIQTLREKLIRARRRSCKRSPSASSSVSHDDDVDEQHKEADAEAEKNRLIERKNSMFKEYEKRHSVSIQHMVRRSSQILLASAQAQAQTRNQTIGQLEPSTSPVLFRSSSTLLAYTLPTGVQLHITTFIVACC